MQNLSQIYLPGHPAVGVFWSSPGERRPPEQSEGMRERLHLPSGLGKPQRPNGGAGASVWGKDVVWASLLTLQHP